MDDTTLKLLGALATFALGVNGYFLRGIHISMNDLKVELAVLITKDQSKDKDIDDLKRRVATLEKECRSH